MRIMDAATWPYSNPCMCVCVIKDPSQVVEPVLAQLDDDGLSPLHVAAQWGHAAAVQAPCKCVSLQPNTLVLAGNAKRAGRSGHARGGEAAHSYGDMCPKCVGA